MRSACGSAGFGPLIQTQSMCPLTRARASAPRGWTALCVLVCRVASTRLFVRVTQHVRSQPVGAQAEGDVSQITVTATSGFWSVLLDRIACFVELGNNVLHLRFVERSLREAKPERVFEPVQSFFEQGRGA